MALNEWNDFFVKKNIFIIRTMEIPVWNNYKRLLSEIKLPLKPRILELGCGSGFISLLLAKKYKAEITLVDYSSNALKIAEELFKKEGLKVKLMKADFFKMKTKKEYDLVHSQGVIEHFKEKQQNRLIKIHKEFLKKDGKIIILAPRPSFYYNIWRGIIEKIKGRWIFGYEKPITKKEGIKLIEKQGLRIKKLTNSMLEHGYLCEVKK